MEQEQNFLSSCHPVTGFTWYVLVVICSVMLQHPVYMILTLVAAILNYLTLTGKDGSKLILGMIPLFLFLSCINPVFNTYGERILFTYFGRPYTLEALLYGIVIAAMFLSVLLLFFGSSKVLSSDRFISLFGKMIPSLSLLLVMVLRLLPSYKRKAEQISRARDCIGKGISGNATYREKAENGLIVLGALTGWALESSVVTADSMRSRGFGSTDRTSFQLYRFRMKDGLCMAAFLITFAGTIAGMISGAAKAVYTPQMEIAAIHGSTILPLAAYGILLFTPILLHYLEELKWHILRSGI